MDTETKSLEQFIAENHIEFECRAVPSRPDNLMPDSAFHYRVTIKHTEVYSTAGGQCGHTDHQFSLYFSQGSAHTSNPTLADVLDCLASDASGYENAKSFEEWASEYGYDADSRSAEKIFKAVKRQAEQLKRTIGEQAYEDLLYNTERL